MNIPLLQQVSAFVWQEADMLDHGEFADWLKLWTDDGLYVVPIDPEATDFDNTLNYAYDDHAMREKRVTRLTSGESISTWPRARTVRSLSRLRVLGEADGVVTVRAAQDLKAFRKDVLREHIADVTYELRRDGDGFRLQRKVVRLINATDTLTSIGFIL